MTVSQSNSENIEQRFGSFFIQGHQLCLQKPLDNLAISCWGYIKQSVSKKFSWNFWTTPQTEGGYSLM